MRPARVSAAALAAVLVVVLTAVLAGLLAHPRAVPTASTDAGTTAPTRVDPAALDRGPDPAVAHLVGDVIRDGDLAVRAPRRGVHDALWVVAGGYLVRDHNVGPRRHVRVVRVSRTGERQVLARSPHWISVAVGTGGRRVAVQEDLGDTSEWSVVTVMRATTGRVIARRTLRLSTLVALSRSQVLLGRRAYWRDPATAWWDLHRDRLRRVHDQAAVRADLRHDRVVFTTSDIGEFCLRVAQLSRPRHTLWRSCRRAPHAWSPDGRHVLQTHTYFDAAGTDTWWIGWGRSGRPVAAISGRLDWQAVWEDDAHALTLAQGEDGTAAIVRCDLAGACERASRLWDVPLPEEPSLYYASPPVVLAE